MWLSLCCSQLYCRLTEITAALLLQPQEEKTKNKTQIFLFQRMTCQSLICRFTGYNKACLRKLQIFGQMDRMQHISVEIFQVGRPIMAAFVLSVLTHIVIHTPEKEKKKKSPNPDHLLPLVYDLCPLLSS